MVDKNEDLTFTDRLELIKAMYGATNGSDNPPPDDEEYAIFTSGAYADRQFKRISRPSYSQQMAVEEIRLQASEVCFRMGRAETKEQYRQQAERIKQNVCEELGWDPDEKISWELSGIAYHEKILPLIVRGDLPEDWDIKDTNGYEIERILRDFLLGT